MRALVEKGGNWVTEKPDDLTRWMWRYDGESAVVVDDATKTYYCGTEAICQEYRKKGKRAEMFSALARQLLIPAVTDGRKQPIYCATGDAWCSSKLPTRLGPTPCRHCA